MLLQNNPLRLFIAFALRLFIAFARYNLSACDDMRPIKLNSCFAKFQNSDNCHLLTLVAISAQHGLAVVTKQYHQHLNTGSYFQDCIFLSGWYFDIPFLIRKWLDFNSFLRLWHVSERHPAVALI